MKALPQAGLAVAVVQDGKIIHQKGYGMAAINQQKKADENTLFLIASNSKAFTATALGILVDQGKLDWNDKVRKYIPEFKMYDPYVTEHFTIIDLLTHRSGLGLGAGDLLFIPDGNNYTLEDILNSFQYQKPVSEFRTKYDYDNLLYLIAGEVVHRVSGKTWDAFVETEIMQKLGMKNSRAIYQNVKNNTNVAEPHNLVNGKINQIPSYDDKGVFGAAGGIYASVNEMSQWMMMLLNGGKYGADNKALISPKVHQELWKIHTNLAYNAIGTGYYKTHYLGYGLGFFLRDQNGYTVLDHTGGMPGMLSKVTLIPELNVGIVVLTNAEPGGYSFHSVSNSIKDRFIGLGSNDWIDWAKKTLAASAAEGDSVTQAVWKQVELSKKTNIDQNNFVGTFQDPWFGTMEITLMDKQLYIRSARSPKLSGTMHLYKANTFAIKWDYRDMECDAFASFILDENGKATGFTMKGISPNMDFSFDFQDLNFSRKK